MVDKVCKLKDDSLLSEEHLPKGSMQIVDSVEMQRLLDKTQGLESRMVTGGSAANTASGLANMGIETAFVGVVGEDFLGTFFSEQMSQNHIVTRLIRNADLPTGLALTLVSQDGERTFATDLGASVSLKADDINAEMFSDFDYLHVEGYQIDNRDLLTKIIESAKAARCKVSIDLASYNVVEQNLDFLKHICKGVEVIFANEQEAQAFSGLDAEKALEVLADYAKIAVVKVGEKGSFVMQDGKKYRIEKSSHTLVDTTGAGDLYAGGFLAGLCLGLDVERCGRMGSVLAGNVIEVMGTKMDPDHWAKVHRELREE